MEECLGVNETLPDFIETDKFLIARLKEMIKLKEQIGNGEKTTSIFQRLPKNMRRRAMSHSVKRVPRNLRNSHKRQLQKHGALKKIKVPRKLHRKRPKQLLLDYNRRQNTKTWLETHIWHAKRFRMEEKWNHKIPKSSYEKTFKTSYRATFNYCLLQDISYYSCVELSGPFEALVKGFELITSPRCGLTIRAKCWVEGYREGAIHIFHANAYPYKAIGNVNFMWKPQLDIDTSDRTLWIWCSPAIHDELVNVFISIFELKNIDESSLKSDSDDKSKSEKMKVKGIELTKLKTRNIPVHKKMKYICENSEIIMTLLKNTLNRFRLTGNLSNSVITKALHSAESFQKTLFISDANNWWINERGFIKESFDSLRMLQKYSSPTCFPRNQILGCNIIDPRLYMKNIRTKMVPNNHDNTYCNFVDRWYTYSAIWNSDIRDKVTTNKWDSAKINLLRSKQFVPGFDNQLLKSVNNVIPILLIQRPGCNSETCRLNYGCGWDIVLPANWAMPVWLSLILCGARAGGSRETNSINFESQKSYEIAPDTAAGHKFFEELKISERCDYFKRPPKKRTNFMKYGIPSPFYNPWHDLVKSWTGEDSFYVLRDRNELRKLKKYIEESKSKKYSLPYTDFATSYRNALIPVSVTIIGKGNLSSFSMICLPTKKDMADHNLNMHHSGPNEKKHSDTNKDKRKALKKAHVKELKRLRRERIQTKKLRMKDGHPFKIIKRKISPTVEIVQNYLNQMNGLWLPTLTDISSLRNYCSKEICGFIVVGGYSYSQAKASGQGYIVLEALLKLFRLMNNMKSGPLLLTRTINSMNYRYCDIIIAN